LAKKIIQAASCIGKTSKENIPEVAAISEISDVNKELEAIRVRLEKTPSGDIRLDFEKNPLSSLGLDQKEWSHLKMSRDDQTEVMNLAIKKYSLKRGLLNQTVHRLEDQSLSLTSSVYTRAAFGFVSSSFRLAELGCCSDSSDPSRLSVGPRPV
jgi:hypothetical protein